MKVEGLMRGSDLREVYILLLKEKVGNGFYPLLVDKGDFDKLERALQKRDYSSSMLMNKLARRVGMTLLGVRLMQPHNGQTQALIDFELLNEIVSIRASAADAVVASLETHSSVWIANAVFEKQNKINTQGSRMAFPITAMSENLIKEALEAAVKNEDYELAGALKKELIGREAERQA